MKKILLSGMFFIATPLTLVTAMFFLLILVHEGTPSGKRPTFITRTTPVAYAALPSGGMKFDQEIFAEGAKEESLRQFFTKYNSPLVDYADFIVTTADKYQLDHRLIPAIAMQETNLCLKSKEGSHNCWGYNVTGGKYKFFDSYEQAIETVSRTLAEQYRDKHGLVTPDEIQQRYTPSSNGSWANAVNYFMAEL